MKPRTCRPIRWSALLLLCSCLPLAAQQPPTDQAQAAGQQGQGAVPQQNPAQNVQSISQTGLLPVYGVDARVDPSWVDGSQFPSQAVNFPNSGTNAAFQQVWAALQPAGYSVLRVPLDVRDSTASANRAANLCVWAKNNNVQLILLLTAADPAKPIAGDISKKVADFAKALVALMRGNGGQYLANYTQIMAYQIEEELNHSGKHGGMAKSAAQQLALAAAHSLRDAERDALDGSGLSATPLMASASFDFDLVSAGAIAGGAMPDAAYSQAYQALKQFLTGLSGSADFDLLAVDWFAGSVGGGGIEKAPELLKSLLTDLPGKQIVLGTGFSTAFRSADEQKRLFTTAFANLSDFRASIGTDCPFVGTIFREALNGNTPDPAPPRATLPGEMDKWDWTAKAAELSAMWTKKKKSADMTWWLTRVENNMGLVTLQNDASGNLVAANALPAQQGMSQIAGAVSDVNSQMAAGAPSSPYASSFQTGGNATTAYPSTDPNASAYGEPAQQPLQPAGQPQGAMASSPYGAAPSNAWNQPQQSAANPYGGAPASSYWQSGCTPNNPGQPQYTDPNAPQPYGQSSPTACAPAGVGYPMAQGFQAVAQQGMMGLLNAVLQRISGPRAGAGGSAFSSGPNNNVNNTSGYGTTNPSTPASPYNYYNSATTPGQTDGQPSANTMYSQPSGVAPISVQIEPQDVSIQPSNPQVGAPVTISVNLHNQSAADAYGLVVQAGGNDGSTLAQQASVHAAPNSSTPVQLQWIPSAASPSYGITISVSDGSGNQVTAAQLGPVVVTAPPGSGNASSFTGSGSDFNASAGTGSTASATEGTGKACSTTTTGSPGDASGMSAGASSAPSCGAATSDVGNTSGAGVSGATSRTSGSTKTTNPLGSVKLTLVQVGVPGQTVAAGQAASVVVPLLNPYLVLLSNIKATLNVDGQAVQTQTMSTLLPQQSRSLIFQGVSFAQPGSHQIAVSVDSQRPGASTLTSTMTRQITIMDASATSATTTTGSAAAGGSASVSTTPSGAVSGTPAAAATGSVAAGGSASVSAPSGGAGKGTPATPVRSVTPPIFQIGRTILPSGSSSPSPNKALSLADMGTSAAAMRTTPANGANGATRTGQNTVPAVPAAPPARTTPSGRTATSSPPSVNTSSRPSSAAVTGATVTPGSPLTPPATPPVRAITTGATTTTTSPGTGLPARPAPFGATSTSNSLPAPQAGAPIRPIASGGAATTTQSRASNPPKSAPGGATGTPSATPVPPVRPVVTSGNTTTTASGTGLPVRPAPPGMTGVAGTVGASPAPSAGAPVRPIASSGVATASPPGANAPARPGPGSSTSIVGAAAAASTQTAAAPVRPGPIGATTATQPTGAALPGRPGPSARAPASGVLGSPGVGGPSSANPQANLDLSVSPQDMHCNLAPSRPGQSTTVNATLTALVRNLGTSGVQSATVVFSLIAADGRQAAVSQPVAVSIAGRGTYMASWSTVLPMGQQVQIVVTVAANGDVNPANNRAVLSFATPPRK